MPKKLHEKLAKIAKQKFPKDKERQDDYVFAVLDRVKK